LLYGVMSYAAARGNVQRDERTIERGGKRKRRSRRSYCQGGAGQKQLSQVGWEGGATISADPGCCYSGTITASITVAALAP
jgi:hypothetical protein